MITVTQAVSRLLQNDEIALEAMRAGILNYSAYSEEIHKKIEEVTFKDVQKGTIVVALSRIAKKSKSLLPPLKPEINLDGIEVKSSLSMLTFEKTADILRKISTLYPFHISPNEIFALSEGPTEITLVVTEKSKEKILKHFNEHPLVETNDLVDITVRFKEEDQKKPNFYYALLSALATKRIPVRNLVSTLNHVSFLIDTAQMEEALKTLNMHFTSLKAKLKKI